MKDTYMLLYRSQPLSERALSPSEANKKSERMFHFVKMAARKEKYPFTVKILKIGTPEIITITVLQLEQLDFTVKYCVQKMQTE